MPVYPSACFKSITRRRILMTRNMKRMLLEAVPIPHFLWWRVDCWKYTAFRRKDMPSSSWSKSKRRKRGASYIFLRNVGILPSDYMVSHPRMQYSSYFKPNLLILKKLKYAYVITTLFLCLCIPPTSTLEWLFQSVWNLVCTCISWCPSLSQRHTS
jgi:hypothetical protein